MPNPALPVIQLSLLVLLYSRLAESLKALPVRPFEAFFSLILHIKQHQNPIHKEI